jgi:prohibitin 1
MYKRIFNKISVFGLLVLASCAVVEQDQVGVKRRFGKVSPEIKEPGLVFHNPLTSSVITVYVRTKNLAINENLPSKEGLTVRSESSILYSIKPEDVPIILKQTGIYFERDLILPVYRSAAADICSQYDAKDMHSSKRNEIEIEIKKRMQEILTPKGFVIEAVLMKSISLPERISSSIERKLEAEQEALRLAFVTEQQKREVERQIILEEGNREMAKIKAEGQKNATIIQAEAKRESDIISAEGKAKAIEIEGVALKRYNEQINSTLTPTLLKLKQVEAFKKLAASENPKTIMIDQNTPVMNMFGKD